MNEKQKEKMAELKKQMQAKMQDKILQNNVLFQECLTALSDYLIIEDNSEVERITDIASSEDAEMHSHDELIELNVKSAVENLKNQRWSEMDLNRFVGSF